MTFGILHADNFIKAYRNYQYVYFLGYELHQTAPTFGESLYHLDMIQGWIQAKYELMKGWENNGLLGMERNGLISLPPSN
jgi:hypothetical protein